MKEDTEKAYEAAVAAAVARGEVPEEKTADVDGKPAENDTVLPVARVKRIIKLDKDVKQASADAIKCVTKATELFLEGLAVGSHAGMRAAKRKGVQYKDLESFVLRRGKYEFLHDHVWAMRPREGEKGDDDDDDDDDDADDDAPSAKKAKKLADANGSRRVTEFFKPGESPTKKPANDEDEIVIDAAPTQTQTAAAVIPETEIQTQ
jgi:histone H3/H4